MAVKIGWEENPRLREAEKYQQEVGKVFGADYDPQQVADNLWEDPNSSDGVVADFVAKMNTALE